MSNTSLVLVFQTARPVSEYPVKSSTAAWEEIRSIRNLVQKIESGAWPASFTAQTSASAPVCASGTFTLTYASISNNDTAIIGKTTLTCVTGTPTTGQFKKQTDATVTAANMAAAINADSTLGKIVHATSALGVVTITALMPGALGNEVGLTGSTGIVAGASYLASGAGGAETVAVTYSKGV